MFIKKSIRPLLEKVDALIFDVDGVLLNVRRSFWDVILRATRKYLNLLGIKSEFKPQKRHIKLLKMAGGFNNDWDATSALILLSLAYNQGVRINMEELSKEIYKRGGGLRNLEEILKEIIPHKWDEVRSLLKRELVERLFKEIYAGKETYRVYGFQPQFVSPSQEGLYKRERILVKREDIPPFIKHLGIFTGRTKGETVLALKMLGFEELIPWDNIITADDGLNKPDRDLLQQLARRMGGEATIYVGDALDDLRSVPFDEPDILSCIVQRGDIEIYKKEGADIIVPETRRLFQILEEVRCVKER